jgi:tol-pal system protein YbgF
MAIAAALCGMAPAAHALLNDNEARKAIVDLRERVTEQETQAQARLAELAAANTQLLEQLALMRRGLLELRNEIESLRGELARMRGGNEVLARDVAELQKRLADANQAFDQRLRGFEPMKATQDGLEVTVLPAEKRAFDAALENLRGGEFDKAVAALNDFRRRWPDSALTPSAQFWLANALFAKRDHREAVAAYRAFASAHPQHPSAPEALLNLAASQAELKDVRGARRTIEDLIKAHPASPAAETGRQRLPTLR